MNAVLNVDRLLKVAEAIETNSIPNVEFNMNHFNFEYQNTKHRCIAGYTQEVFPDEYSEAIAQYKNSGLGEFLAVNRVFGIEQPKEEYVTSKSFPLYYPQNTDMNYADITRDQAAEVLRQFAETGIVDWDIDAPAAA